MALIRDYMQNISLLYDRATGRLVTGPSGPTAGGTAGALQSATGTDSASGDTTIIAAPGAGNRIVIAAFQLQNESAVATTMILKDGATAWRRTLGQNQGDGVAVSYGPGLEKRLAANAALVLNLSGANACGYSVDYYIEATS